MGSTEAEVRKTYRKKMEEATDLVEKLRFACLSRGVNGIRSLGRTFRIFDDDGSKSLNIEEFLEGMHDYQVPMTDDQCKELFKIFDNDGNGTLNFEEFLTRLQPPMTESRKAVVEKAFAKADRSGDGVFTEADLRGVYKATMHPKYMSGEWTEGQVRESFLAQFETPAEADGKVTKDEFMKYYANLGASIDNDAYFDLMVRQAWKI